MAWFGRFGVCRIFRLPPLIAVGMLLAGTPAAAQSAADYGCDRPVRLAFYEFGALYHDGAGIDRDVVEEVARRTGCQFVTDVEPRSQIWKELQAGTLDMTPSGLRNDARRQFVYFVPYLGLKNAVVAERAIADQITSFDDVVAHPEWRIGVVQAYLYGPYFDFRLNLARKQTQVYPDQDAIYRALQEGEVNVIISPAFNYEFYFRTPEQRQRFAMADVSPAPPIPQNMIFSQKRFTAGQLGAWSRLFEQMYLDGTIMRICEDHVSAQMARALLTY